MAITLLLIKKWHQIFLSFTLSHHNIKVHKTLILPVVLCRSKMQVSHTKGRKHW